MYASESQFSPDGFKLSKVFHMCAQQHRKTMNKINNLNGGGGEIRTLETLPFTRFPGELLQPLGHSTATLTIYQIHC